MSEKNEEKPFYNEPSTIKTKPADGAGGLFARMSAFVRSLLASSPYEVRDRDRWATGSSASHWRGKNNRCFEKRVAKRRARNRMAAKSRRRNRMAA